MAASMPDIEVSIALTSGYLTAAASRTWTDVSAFVEADRGLSIQYGRPDEFSSVQASTLSLTLNNDGRFTPENVSGAYYPNIKKGRPIRVRATSQGNLLPANDASFETSVAGWSAAASAGTPPVLSQSAVRAQDGTKSMLITWAGTGGTGHRAATTASGLTIGLTYTFSAYLYVPTGSPSVEAGLVTSGSVSMTTKDAWTRVSQTFVAASATPALQVASLATSTAGTCYVDAVQLELGSSASTFTTAAGSTRSLFTGYIDQWPVEWENGTGTYSLVTITATSRMARLGRFAEFKSIVEEEILYDDPVLYFPLGEPAGALEAGNIAPGRSERLVVTQQGTGGPLAFGAGTGPGTDDLTAPVLTPVDSFNGQYLHALLTASLVASGDHHIQLESCFTTTSVVTQYVVALTGDLSKPFVAVPDGFSLAIDAATGKAIATLSATNGGFTLSVLSGSSVRDGSVHHVAATATLDDGTGLATVSLTTDGVTVSSTSAGQWPYGASGARFFTDITHLYVGGHPFAQDGSCFNGTISHVAVYARPSSPVSTSRFAQHALAATTGFAGEASGARIQRYARLASIPTAEVSTETGLSTSIAHKDTSGQTPLSLMQAVTDTEDGVLFDARDGTLTFQARSHRYNTSSSFTLDCNAGDLDGFNPTLDDQHLVNDITASRPLGVQIHATNDASITEYGYYRETAEILTTSDNEVQSRADWQVNRFGTPRVTVPNVAVDLTTCSSALKASLLAADIGIRFTLTNLPSQAPATTVSYFIEGITYNITDSTFRVSFNTSAADYANVWQLDSASYSQLDSTTVLAY